MNPFRRSARVPMERCVIGPGQSRAEVSATARSPDRAPGPARSGALAGPDGWTRLVPMIEDPLRESRAALILMAVAVLCVLAFGAVTLLGPFD